MLVDDVLGVVEEDRVPREVRDWLTLTFTRTAAASAPKRLSDEKQLKFRSVAHAIRAGIVVDRFSLTLVALTLFSSLAVASNQFFWGGKGRNCI